MSAGNAASKSRAQTIPPAFSRNTISSPRRKISTSELLTLNFFGSLTAWLFPDRNTRAVAIFHLTCIYIRVYTYFKAIFQVEQDAEGTCCSQVFEDPFRCEPTFVLRISYRELGLQSSASVALAMGSATRCGASRLGLYRPSEKLANSWNFSSSSSLALGTPSLTQSRMPIAFSKRLMSAGRIN